MFGSIASLTHGQTDQIQEVLSQKKADLIRLEYEVEQARARLEELTRKLDETRQSISAHRALLVPFRRLPIEIIQEIFFHCLPSEGSIGPRLTKVPLLLSSVCSPWRSIVLSTPKLWSSFGTFMLKRNSERVLKLMRLWVQRSRRHPFSVCAYLVEDIPSLDALEFLNLIYSCCHRIKQLDLAIPDVVKLLLVDYIGRGMPYLECLDVRVLTRGPDDMVAFPNSRLTLSSSSAPRLRRFSWSCRNPSPLSFDLNATHITFLRLISSLSIPECLDVLLECPHLQEFILCDWRTTEPSTQILTLPHVTLPHLLRMCIKGNQGFDMLLDSLTLPALETLSITGSQNLEEDTVPWRNSALGSLLSRSHCSIVELQFIDLFSSEEELIQCLQWTSNSLVMFQLLDWRGITMVTDRVLRLLTVRQAADGSFVCLCPKLEHVRFGACMFSSDGVLAEMVESRWNASSVSQQQVARLKSINPRLGVNHADDIKRLGILQEQGLKLH